MQKPKIGVLGPKYTFSEQAAFKFIKSTGAKVNIEYFDNTESIFDSIVANKINLGIVAIENMIHGTIISNLEQIYENNLKINAEIILEIELSMGINSHKKEINEVYSHPIALKQVRNFLKNNYPDAKQVPTESTVAAIKKVKNNPFCAAIGLTKAILANKLNIIEQGVEDYPNNMTSFYVVSKHKNRFNLQNPHSALIILPKTDKPGLLLKILQPFSKNNINLVKIESRPTKSEFGRYFFFMVVQQNDSKILQRTINELNDLGVEIKILGSYERFI